jgi:hypothetical protein
MVSSYNNIKNFFKYIMKFEYKIIHDDDTYDIISIKYDNKELKCKCILIFTLNNDNLFWSNDNIYNDQKTRQIVSWIKYNLVNNKNLNIKDINSVNDKENLKLIIKSIINLDEDLNKNFGLNSLCVITDNLKEYKQFYLITELLYF